MQRGQWVKTRDGGTRPEENRIRSSARRRKYQESIEDKKQELRKSRPTSEKLIPKDHRPTFVKRMPQVKLISQSHTLAHIGIGMYLPADKHDYAPVHWAWPGV